jgi:transposase-like protein
MIDFKGHRFEKEIQKFAPQLEAEFRRSGNKRPVGTSWRMDETYIKVNGQWKYLYRAVDKAGQTVDFLLTAHRDKKAALRFFRKAPLPTRSPGEGHHRQERGQHGGVGSVSRGDWCDD